MLQIRVFDKNANYLITGALGGLGLILAQWLVQQGAEHIILVSRRAPDLEQQKQIDALGVEYKNCINRS